MAAESLERVVIETSIPGVRLDAWLTERLPDVSRGAVKRLLDQGLILVNDGPVKPSYKPVRGDVVTIDWPEPEEAEALPEEIPVEVLYEDEDVIAINKAAGMVTHPAHGNESGTVVNALLHHCRGQLSGIGGVARPGIVHRLDKDTSGVLIVAKTDPAHVGLASAFAERRTKKLYWAIACGVPQRAVFRVDAPIARAPTDRKRMAIESRRGKPSKTTFRTLRRFADASLIEADLHTGRTHQIRVHLSSVGHAVFGDLVYGERATKRLAQRLGRSPNRQALHAARLEVVHPITGKTLCLEAPMPQDMSEILGWLGPES